MNEVTAANEHVHDSKALLAWIDDLKVKYITVVAGKLLFADDCAYDGNEVLDIWQTMMYLVST